MNSGADTGKKSKKAIFGLFLRVFRTTARNPLNNKAHDFSW